MIDKPGVDERVLAAEVAAAWAVDIADLLFMPVGLDGNAWAHRVDTSDGERYFLKLRRGEFTRAAVRLPGFLRAQGVRQAVAPIDLSGGGAGRGFGDHQLLLYPFHAGGSLWSRGLTDRQWIEYGEFLGRLHVPLPSDRCLAMGSMTAEREIAGEE
ncbi:hypothetical protein [Micromonospora fulviviridis]|uniref:Aminoglycoside phosphotransferase n=1 Tax=Micromonospora fulviviridis TaxID=47860 RepID=A0ABV2VQQ3_9ACTN